MLFCFDPKQDQAIADQRRQGMAHGGQIYQQALGEFRHGWDCQGHKLREQALLGRLEATWA